MKIALITDTHIGARNDNILFQNYFDRFYENIFFPYIDEHNIKSCIHLGDVVDRRKYINFRSLNYLRNDIVGRMWEMGVDTHILVGNHDSFYKNTNDINSMQELFSTSDGLCEPWIYSSPREYIFNDTKILMMPWINSDNYTECINAIDNSEAQIMMGHLEINGFEMHRGQICDIGFDAKIFSKFDLVFSGHFHHKSTQGGITYLGNPYEIIWSDFDDARGFHIFDTATRDLEFIQNPYHMFYKIYYDDSKETFESIKEKDYSVYNGTIVKVIVTQKNNPYWFDTMLDELYKADVANVSVVENVDLEFEDDSIVDETEDTLTILGNYIDTLNIHQKNKKELDTLIKTLYTEALDYEIAA
jgi:DNA repair exonuclease SbcCD nuclease subunit